MVLMMKSRKLLAMVLSAVSEQTDVSVEKIMSRNRVLEAVDARHICVKLLIESGVYQSRVAELMGMTPRNVQYINTDFDTRIMFNRLLRNNYEKAAKKLRKQCEASD